jgi:hypothetical protein
VHLQKSSDVFINLRALVNEKAITGIGNNVNGLGVIGSTGYDSGQSWFNQPGALFFTSGGDVYRIAGIMAAVGAMPAYYIFARNNMIYVWIEYATGLYQWLIFGKMDKYSTFTGGMLYSGSSPTLTNVATATYGFFNNQLGGNGVGQNLYGALYANLGTAGWLVPDSNDSYPAMPKVFDNIGLYGNQYGTAGNTFNNQSVLLPVEICISRDGHVNHDLNTNFGIEGILPDLYLCNMRFIQAAQQLDDGSGNIFRCLPFSYKSNTSLWGVAIKEN